jgi:hypothetical protein
METVTIAGFFCIAGFVCGVLWGYRLVERECEMAYLTGHVDGHRKAEEELG